MTREPVERTSRCLDRLGSLRHGMRKRCGMPAELDEATELHSHQKSRRNSRAIVPRTTARTRNNAAKAFCNGARPFCIGVNAFCNDARPFCSRATPRAMMRDRFTRLQEGFAMMRGEIAQKRQIFATPRAIKTAGRRLFQ